MKTSMIVAALLLTLAAGAQHTLPEKKAIAQWMIRYDAAAWRMSELVTDATHEQLSRMGKEWFCFIGSDSLWHGVYGKYLDTAYDVVLHYCIDANDTIDISCQELDTAMLHSVSRAIRIAYREAGSVLKRSFVKFNKFVRYNQDKTVSVWLMPALQPNEIAMYGAEFYYHFDETGTNVLEKDEYYQGSFKGFRLGKRNKVLLSYEDRDEPTQGAIFFAMLYKDKFASIKIVTRSGAGTLSYHQ